MNRISAFIYGIVCYAIFLIAFLYAIGFVGNVVVPKSIDSGSEVGIPESLLVNLILLGLFAVQHSVMARPGFKRWWTKIVPTPVERSTYVLFASLLLLLLFWQWRPMTGSIWNVEMPVAKAVLIGIFYLGWGIVLLSTFMINHFDLFGLRQVYFHLRKQEYGHVDFKTTGLYKCILHPIMLGFIVAFWATPHMTIGHLIFAVGTTAYSLIGIHLEERDLVRLLGEDYQKYRHGVGMLIPCFGKRKPPTDKEQSDGIEST